VNILKYSKTPDEIMKVIYEEIYEKNFYLRRLFLIFFEKSIKKFSINFINELGILEKAIKLFDLNNTLLSNKIISELPNFFALLSEEKRKLILEKITRLQTKEFELNRSIKIFFKWKVEHFDKQSEKFSEQIKTEKERICEENKIKDLNKPKDFLEFKRIDESKKFLKKINPVINNNINSNQTKVFIYLIFSEIVLIK
jgi:hypothetical protein